MNSNFCVFIVDDNEAVRKSLCLVIENAGFICHSFASAESYLENLNVNERGCLLLDVNLPGLNGLELQAELNYRAICLPIIFLTAHGNIPMTVRTLKAGAVDFFTKPVSSSLLVERIRELQQDENESSQQSGNINKNQGLMEHLSCREQEILPLAIKGISNKEIAKILGISYRTVETHRIRILRKMGTANFLELAQIIEELKNAH